MASIDIKIPDIGDFAEVTVIELMVKPGDTTRLPRSRGTPQGGVVSPILMNLFMQYAFDCWMQRHLAKCPFARYADDAVVHCRTQEQAQEVMQAIASRLAECGLTMHPEKSKIVYCEDRSRTQAYRLWLRQRVLNLLAVKQPLKNSRSS